MKLIVCDEQFNVLESHGGFEESIRFNFHESGRKLQAGVYWVFCETDPS